MKCATLQQLGSAELDLLIIGGGIVGCGIARDAALRGLRTGLIEREDFGAGTTSRSTRLIHGGLRYLELLDFGLVRADMREREVLMRIAPHLVRPLPFLVPMYSWTAWERDRLRIGMALYDLLSYDKSLPWHDFLTRAETLTAEPNLRSHGLQGAARYFDAQVEFPERLALANAIDASEQGAMLRNHTVVERLALDRGRVIGAEARDLCSNQRAMVRARLTVNATGPWLDRTLDDFLSNGHEPLLRTTKGAHLVMPPLSNNAILLRARRDKRVFFVVPWFGYSLIGTTDTDFMGDPATARADAADIAYLLGEAANAFPSVAEAPVYHGMAGVRALVRKEGVKESQVSREHSVRDHAVKGGPDGLISVIGGKITAYRAIAEEVTGLAARRLGLRRHCQTARLPLPGGDARYEEAVAASRPGAGELGLTEVQLRHLVSLYGSRAGEVLRLAESDPRLVAQLCPHKPTIKAQVWHAASAEGAATLADVLHRRAPVGLACCMGLDCLSSVAEALGEALGWDDARREAETLAYRQLVAERQATKSKAEAVPV